MVGTVSYTVACGLLETSLNVVSMGTDSSDSQDIGFVRGLGRETFQNMVVDALWIRG